MRLGIADILLILLIASLVFRSVLMRPESLAYAPILGRGATT